MFQMSQIFLILPIVVFFCSPSKLRTLGRMVLSFVLTVLLITIPAAILRRGNPQMMVMIAGATSLSVAALVGWLHVRSLKLNAKQTNSVPVVSNQP
jgi:hypothetical protein